MLSIHIHTACDKLLVASDSHAYHKMSTGVKAAAGARAGRAIVTAMSVYCHITSPDSPLVPHGGSYELWWLEQEFRAVAWDIRHANLASSLHASRRSPTARDPLAYARRQRSGPAD